VLNATFNNISVISWRSVLLVEETGEPGENHLPTASHCQALSHNVVSSSTRLSGIRTHNVSSDRHWSKSNLKQRQNQHPQHTSTWSLILNTRLHDRSFSWHGTDTSIKSDGVKLVLWVKTLEADKTSAAYSLIVTVWMVTNIQYIYTWRFNTSMIFLTRSPVCIEHFLYKRTRLSIPFSRSRVRSINWHFLYIFVLSSVGFKPTRLVSTRLGIMRNHLPLPDNSAISIQGSIMFKYIHLIVNF
jgi:hypothetical protein